MVIRNLALLINISEMTIERPIESHFDKVSISALKTIFMTWLSYHQMS